MAERNKIKVRTCHTCGLQIACTARELRAHASAHTPEQRADALRMHNLLIRPGTPAARDWQRRVAAQRVRFAPRGAQLIEKAGEL